MLRRLIRPLFARRPPRRVGVRVFGVGAAKTGTHSLASMFEEFVEAAHEADDADLIVRLLQRAKTGSSTAVRQYLVQRDKRRRLKIDASQVNIYLLDDLEALFPDSRYVLTTRPPLDWLRSFIDDSLRRQSMPPWPLFRDFRFGPKQGHPSEERVLADNGLYTLEGYLNYWRDAIERVRRKIPADRLLVVETSDLLKRSVEVAAFCGVGNFRPSAEKAHAFSNPERFHILSEIDRDYLVGLAERICGPLAAELFPDRPISAMADQVLGRQVRKAS